MRWPSLNRTIDVDVWRYSLESHKSALTNRFRRVFLVGDSRTGLSPALLRVWTVSAYLQGRLPWNSGNIGIRKRVSVTGVVVRNRSSRDKGVMSEGVDGVNHARRNDNRIRRNDYIAI
jgi:hypothetical protein